jgi:photosystem II stability/assembly factor-like uncharacterized protein
MKSFLKNGSRRSYISVLVTLLVSGAVAVYLTAINETLNTADVLKKEIEETDQGPDLRPSEWFWEQRTFPHWTADKDIYLEMLREAQAMRAEQTSRISSDLQWEFAGPTNVQGRVQDIEFDPLNPSTVYAAAATGGMFKSTDAGVSWTPIFDDQAILTMGDIAIDPVNSDIIYAGTGEPNGGHNNFPGAGIYKSTDAGLTWELKGLENTVSIGKVLIDPTNTQRVFVAAVGSYFAPNPERGVYRSENGGETWSKVLFVSDSTGAIDVILDPSNPSFMMAAMWERVRRPQSSHLYGETSGLYRSTDGGSNWQLIDPATSGLPNPLTTDVGRIGLAISPSNPNIIYALYNDGYYYLGFFKTTNQGSTWTDADPNNQLSNGFSSFSWYFGQVRVHPTNPDIVYALDVELSKTTNGGTTWTQDVPFHVDFHDLKFDPQNSNNIIMGNDGGIDISTNGGLSWFETSGLPVTQFYEIGLDYNNPQRLYGGTQDNGTNRTLNGGLDDWDHIFGGDGFYVIVDHTNPNVIYAESQYGNLGKSVTGGSGWNGATNGISGSEPTNWSTPVVMDPNNNLVLYYGTNRVYRTENGASSWSAISGDLTDGGPGLGTVTTIAVARTNSDIIWAGTDDSHVWRSTDYGATWNEMSGPNMPYRWVTRVIADPTDEQIAYVTFSGLKWHDPEPHIFRTANMGTTWTDISSNLPNAPIDAIAVDPIAHNVVYIGTDVGAYISFDAGQNWEVMGSGLPLVTIGDMKVHPTQHFLIAGTHGRSMYKIDLTDITGIGPDNGAPIAATFELHQNYPNPFNPTTKISYNLPGSGQVHLKIYNVMGQEVRTLVNESQIAGNYTAVWDGRDNHGNMVSSGVYIYRLSAGNDVQSRKMTLLR